MSQGEGRYCAITVRDKRGKVDTTRETRISTTSHTKNRGDDVPETDTEWEKTLLARVKTFGQSGYEISGELSTSISNVNTVINGYK